MRLSKNFDSTEFACKCCGLSKPHPKLIERLQALRDATGRRITVNSGTRCPKHNRAVGGAPKSYHKPQTDSYSYAADIVVAGMTPAYVAAEAKRLGFTGIIVYPTFTHVDVRPKKYHKGI